MNRLNLDTMSNYVEKAFIQDYIKADKFMIYLMFIHWMIATFITSQEYSTHMYGFVNGGVIFLINLILYKLYRGTYIFRYSIGVSIMVFSSIFIQQHLGRIEMHFHVFIAMALLTLYKLSKINKKLVNLRRVVGYGNFNLIGLDEALLYARRYSKIGKFSKDEIALFEEIFYHSADEYGFYGKKSFNRS